MFTCTLVGKPDLPSYRQTVIPHVMNVGGTRDILNMVDLESRTLFICSYRMCIQNLITQL